MVKVRSGNYGEHVNSGKGNIERAFIWMAAISSEAYGHRTKRKENLGATARVFPFLAQSIRSPWATRKDTSNIVYQILGHHDDCHGEVHSS